VVANLVFSCSATVDFVIGLSSEELSKVLYKKLDILVSFDLDLFDPD
jgi:hypothetical protein